MKIKKKVRLLKIIILMILILIVQMYIVEAYPGSEVNGRDPGLLQAHYSGPDLNEESELNAEWREWLDWDRTNHVAASTGYFESWEYQLKPKDQRQVYVGDIIELEMHLDKGWFDARSRFWMV